jgi:hypothetical protein
MLVVKYIIVFTHVTPEVMATIFLWAVTNVETGEMGYVNLKAYDMYL